MNLWGTFHIQTLTPTVYHPSIIMWLSAWDRGAPFSPSGFLWNPRTLLFWPDPHQRTSDDSQNYVGWTDLSHICPWAALWIASFIQASADQILYRIFFGCIGTMTRMRMIKHVCFLDVDLPDQSHLTGFRNDILSVSLYNGDEDEEASLKWSGCH